MAARTAIASASTNRDRKKDGAKYATGPGGPRRRNKPGKHSNEGMVCIRYRKRKPKRCTKFGTKAQARRLGLL